MRRRIAVVDDSREVLMVIEDILTDEGYDVVTFPSPQDALTRLVALHPDLIILDYFFGHVAYGGHLLHLLKQNQATAHIPVILCTGAALSDAAVAGYVATGAVMLVPKPFSIDDLLSAVQQMLVT